MYWNRERVKAQAEGGQFTIDLMLSGRARVESSYPIRVCATGEGGGAIDREVGDTGVYFEVTGRAVGFVPVVICGLATHDVPDATASNGARGLWLDINNDGNWILLNQESSTGENDFWQVNYDRQSKKYEYVYNVEFFTDKTGVSFGTRPDAWPGMHLNIFVLV